MVAEPANDTGCVRDLKQIAKYLGVGLQKLATFRQRPADENRLVVMRDHIGLYMDVAELETWKARERMTADEAAERGLLPKTRWTKEA